MAVFSRNVPNSAAAVCCCWILVLQIPSSSEEELGKETTLDPEICGRSAVIPSHLWRIIARKKLLPSLKIWRFIECN
eukprot:COSAG01_NODE_39312_length_478_cov_0.897098_1_plen_76_part_10